MRRAQPSAQEAAATLGAVGLVISALVAFPDAHRLQWQGIRALAKMAEGRSATQTAVGRAGGVALIVAALGAHQNVAGGGVIKQCCMAREVLVIGHAGNLATVSATPGIRAALQQTLKESEADIEDLGQDTVRLAVELKQMQALVVQKQDAAPKPMAVSIDLDASGQLSVRVGVAEEGAL